MKKITGLFSLAMLCLFANAQENDSLKKRMQAGLAARFPVTRTFDMQFLQYMPADFDTELLDKEDKHGEMQSYSKFRVGVNIPVIKKKKWNLTSSLFYRYDAFDMKNVTSKTDVLQPAFNTKSEFHTFTGALSFTYFSTLFGKPFIYNASGILDGTREGSELFKGLIGGSMVFKQTSRTVMTVGVLVFLDPTSPVPFAPVFSIDHKFRNSAWVMDLILPQRLLFRRSAFKNGRLSVGTEIAGDAVYVYNFDHGNAPVYTFSQQELRSGLTYEHSINKLILTAKIGFSNQIGGRLTEKGKPTGDYIMKLKRDGTMYFGLGVSYNIFNKKQR